MKSNIIAVSSLPIEIILEIFTFIPTRRLCVFMVLSQDINIEIRKIIFKRFHQIFWNEHRRLLVFITRYLLDFVPIHNAFDLTFKSLNQNDLMATFTVDLSQPKGTVGPNHAPLWGLKLRGDGVLRDPLNEPIFSPGWDIPSEVKEARVYVFDSETDQKKHPLIRTFYVTRGSLRQPITKESNNNKFAAVNTILETGDGWWTRELVGRRFNKEFSACANFTGKNQHINDGVVGMLRGVRVVAPMLLTAIEEKRKDGHGGIKYLVLDGGQSYMQRKGCCIS